MKESVLGDLLFGAGEIKSVATSSWSSSSSSAFSRSAAFDYGGGHHRWNLSAVAGSIMDSGNPFSKQGIEFSVEGASGENRTAVGEVDFFSNEKKKDAAIGSPTRVQPDLKIKKEDLTINTGLQLSNTRSDQSTIDDGIWPNQDEKEDKNELAATQAELGRMNEENKKLKIMLKEVVANYSALQIRFDQLVQQQATQNDEVAGRGTVVPKPFIDLSLALGTKYEASNSSSAGFDRPASPNNEAGSPEYQLGKRGISSNEDATSEHDWNPNKAPKLDPSKSAEEAQEATIRKARVSVRDRSEAPMITDGCQWRKYGQKMSKGNPCPRAYYRCTMAFGCPVRKQVQRCAEDSSILITTYEGTHNHPLPPAAMAMASTTSAAASMLLSGSMSSAEGMMRTILPSSSSMVTISASTPFPIVTLDLTQNTNNPLQLQRPQSQFQLPFGASAFRPAPPQAQPMLPQVFGESLHNQTKLSGVQMSPDVNAPQLPNPKGQAPAVLSPALADSVTAAITRDPKFTAALAAAISSVLGTNHLPAAVPGNDNGTSNDGNNSDTHNTSSSNLRRPNDE